jgi:undecaprenyl-diphosphatase
MTYFQAIIIAIIEGLTEFLPISSTAHMRLYSMLVGDGNDTFTNLFEIVIQLAAIGAVVVVYYKRFFTFSNITIYYKLALAVVPSLVAGVLLKKHIDAALGSVVFIAIVMIVGGVILLFIDRFFTNNTIATVDDVNYKKSFSIGCFQVLAVLFPGLSRSASTIIGGLQQGLTRQAAAEFSFFLAIPTMFAASAKSLLDVYQTSPEILNSNNMITLTLGFVVSFLVSLFAIRFFIDLLLRYGFKPFGYYRIVLGSAILVYYYFVK